MEDSDRISDNEVEFTPSEHEPSEVESGNIPTRKRIVTTSGNAEWQKQQKEKQEKKKTPEERVKELEDTVNGFRIAHAGVGLLRGSFPTAPSNVQDLSQRISNVEKSVSEFKLEGDGLNVSGSFDKGYTVSRQNPCLPPQESGGIA